MKRLILVGTLLMLAALPGFAFASASVAGGGLAESGTSKSGAALIVSSGSSIPTVPVELQSSLLAPLSGQGGYAATAEVRGYTGGGYGGAYVGAGAGVGNLSSDRTSGAILTAFGGKSIAAFTSIEVRLYKQTRDSGLTAGFLGLRFSF